MTAIEEGQILVSLKEKFHSKLTSWKAWTLSQVGEMVLIKSNLTGVPLFTMEAKKVNKASTMWKCILDHRYLLNKGLY